MALLVLPRKPQRKGTAAEIRAGPDVCMAPQMCRSTNRRESLTDTEVWFRIVHLGQEGHHGGPTAAYREQTVEIALWGPKGAFQSGNIGALTRQVPTDGVVNALPRRKGNPKPPDGAISSN
jgi:hypothetical protein